MERRSTGRRGKLGELGAMGPLSMPWARFLGLVPGAFLGAMSAPPRPWALSDHELESRAMDWTGGGADRELDTGTLGVEDGAGAAA